MKTKFLFAAMALLISVTPVAAQTVGMVANSFNDSVTIIDADSNTVIGSVSIPNPSSLVADCSIAGDQNRGFVSNQDGEVYVVDLSSVSLASGTNPILLSNEGDDTSLSPDQGFLVVTGTDIGQPVAVLDTVSRSEASTFPSSQNHNSVEVCSNGSVLITSTNGEVRRFVLSGSGNLTDTGEVLVVSGRPNNVICAPDGNSGVVVLGDSGTMQSFTVPGLTPVDTRSLSGVAGISGTFNNTGDQVYVRSNFGMVDVFTFNSATASLGASPSLSIPVSFTLPFFGVDQIALHPNGDKLFVTTSGSVDVFDTSSGNLLAQITDDSIFWATGICFPSSATVVETYILEKTITDGPDVDGDGVIDVVVAVNQPAPTAYQWSITYNNPGGPTDVHIVDRPITQWQVNAVDGNALNLPLDCGTSATFNGGFGSIEIHRGGKAGKNCQSATHFTWDVDTTSNPQSVTVDMGTRASPSGNLRFQPRACGAFYLNKGVKAIDLDNPGEPIARSNRLCVAAVRNPGTEPGDRGPAADNDGDGVYDVDEACNNAVKTNPCVADSDGDELPDGADNCPADYNPLQEDEDGNGIGDACED